MGNLQFPFASVVPALGPGYQPTIASANARDIWIVPCADGIERLCKGPNINPKAPCNEWISAHICRLAGFPTLEPVVVRRLGQLYYATPYYQRNSIVTNLRGPADARFHAALNASKICYQAVVADALLANPDRHCENIVLCSGAGATTGWSAYLHDHDAALFGAERMTPRGLSRVEHFISDIHDGWLRHHTAWLREDHQWFLAITDWPQLISTAIAVNTLPDAAIEAIVNQAPAEWISVAERRRLKEMLLQRKSNIVSLLEHRRSLFVNA